MSEESSSTLRHLMANLFFICVPTFSEVRVVVTVAVFLMVVDC